MYFRSNADGPGLAERRGCAAVPALEGTGEVTGVSDADVADDLADGELRFAQELHGYFEAFVSLPGCEGRSG